MDAFQRFLAIMNRSLGLCCHREVGNIPREMLQPTEPRLGRLR